MTAPDPTAESPLVLFDFDGTLVRGDCVGRFLTEELRRRPLRGAFAVLLIPLLPLFLWWRSACIPASAYAWLASVGRSDGELREAARRYIDRLAEQPQRWLIDSAVQRLRAHCLAGDRVIIITGAERWLAQTLWQRLTADQLPVEWIGSTLRRFGGGRIAVEHCVGPRKLDALRRLGLDGGSAAMYSDSARDLPLLRRAARPVMVCPDSRSLRRVRSVLPTVEVLD